ncbi:daptide biosynthesis intramembrane metalloprotease [Actinacidiphila sp. ITFR-21]|uniref:daptide biosynthesis intramembrane metalloprotease n=1 Tax=Actinacidiphila sp. ITFR-21 TaxID=3075199 RepID=UPI00288B2E6A|nr:daptide biosynthesis intramembrane metalloprotease [Streptomyces sp. ITFR-21]WNI16175.1 daptide biosynthesis intramembrane metalloprotease [Streptomyces sp. ITFR-21]
MTVSEGAGRTGTERPAQQTASTPRPAAQDTAPGTRPPAQKTAPGTRPAQDAAPVPDLPARPRLAAGVAVHEPAEPGAPWIVQREDRYLRVGADIARLARVLDGTRDPDGLADRLGAPWNRRTVLVGLRALQARELLDDGTDRPGHRPHRIAFVPPLTLQFTLLRPDRLLSALRPLTTRLAGRPAAVTSALLAVGGVLALAARRPAVGEALGRPLPVLVYAAVLAAFFVSTALHEFGHGLTLSHYGGRPARMGVMLFYLAPAFFCDVTDGWRLPRARQRVRVALAGIGVQAVIAGGSGLTGAVLPAGDARDAVLLFSCLAYVSCLVNLAPLVKLDGYLALMTHLDLPHLRDRAIHDARGLLARVLFGIASPRALDRRWSVPYGLACMVFPVYLIATGIALWSELLLGLGVVGGCVLAVLGCYLLWLVGKGYLRVVREARAAGAGRTRAVLATVVLVAAATAALSFVRVPYTVTGAYERHGDRVDLVLSSTADRGPVRPGAEVTLQRSGVVTHTRVGRAEVAPGGGTHTDAPVTLFAPVRMGHAPSMPAVRYPLTVTDEPAATSGTATVDAGGVPLGELVYRKLAAPWHR